MRTNEQLSLIHIQMCIRDRLYTDTIAYTKCRKCSTGMDIGRVPIFITYSASQFKCLMSLYKIAKSNSNFKIQKPVSCHQRQSYHRQSTERQSFRNRSGLIFLSPFQILTNNKTRYDYKTLKGLVRCDKTSGSATINDSVRKINFLSTRSVRRTEGFVSSNKFCISNVILN